MNRSSLCLLLIVTTGLRGLSLGEPAQAAGASRSPTATAPADQVILNTESLWRVRLVFEPEEVLLKSGDVDHVRLKFKETEWRQSKTIEQFDVEKVPFFRLPADTPRDWMAPDFDDSDWARSGGPLLLDDEKRVEWKLLLLRGAFEVNDPARAAGLRLHVEYKGGIVVWLNGRELTRQHMPKGRLDLYTCAEPDPKEAFLFPDGHIGIRYGWQKPFAEWTNMMEARVRRLQDVAIRPADLRSGRNVLAIALHRPPARWEFYTTRIKEWPYGAYDSRSGVLWSRVALHSIQLTSPAGASVGAGLGRRSAKGLSLWNHSVARKVFTSDYGDPLEAVRPIKIAALRNGTFTGQMVVGASEPITGLSARVSDLNGPGVIPALALHLLYGVADGHLERSKQSWFDTFEDSPSARLDVFPDSLRAVQPICLKVTVPADAKPGTYKGVLTVAAEGLEARQAPIELRVFDWSLPDPDQYTLAMDYFQSPDTVAMQYGVPFWSDEHWELMEKSFALMRPLAARTLYIPCVRRTQLGNEHGMVRWRKGVDGRLTPDLSIAEKYVDLAVKHLGKVPAVVLYVWEPPSSDGEYGYLDYLKVSRTHDRKILITVVGQDGRLEEVEGPAWGTPACREFWKSLSDAMRAALAGRGLEGSMMFGLLGDHRATKMAMDDLMSGSPGTKWAVHSHDYADSHQGYEVGMCSAFWGCACDPADPIKGRGYGWKNPFWLTYNPRDSMTAETELAKYRTVTESWMGALPRGLYRWSKASGVRGLGRQGIDFWKVLGRKAQRSHWSLTLAGRYPETEWGHLNFARGVPALAGPGRAGAVPTTRYEALRENLQECEARIFIEKALLDDALKAKLGANLARRAQEVLDERTRMGLYLQFTFFNYRVRSWPLFVTGWQQRTEQFFGTVAEVAAALAEK
jgi:hypothetical protein